MKQKLFSNLFTLKISNKKFARDNQDIIADLFENMHISFILL